MEDIKIYVSTYGSKVYYGRRQYTGGKKCLIPLEVGASGRDEKHKNNYLYRDDSGENISFENPYYGELTGQYWVWKNTHSKYVGFYHYNKYLKISYNDILYKLNSQYDIIVSKKRELCAHAFQDEMDVLIETLKEYDYNYYKVFKTIVGEDGKGFLSTGNMFITKWEIMDEYFSFLFPLLEIIRKKLGDNEKTAFHKRYCAFFGERLLTPWIEYKGLHPFEVSNVGSSSLIYKVECKTLLLLREWCGGKSYFAKMNDKIEKFMRRSSYL